MRRPRLRHGRLRQPLDIEAGRARAQPLLRLRVRREGPRDGHDHGGLAPREHRPGRAGRRHALLHERVLHGVGFRNVPLRRLASRGHGHVRESAHPARHAPLPRVRRPAARTRRARRGTPLHVRDGAERRRAQPFASARGLQQPFQHVALVPRARERGRLPPRTRRTHVEGRARDGRVRLLGGRLRRRGGVGGRQGVDRALHRHERHADEGGRPRVALPVQDPAHALPRPRRLQSPDLRLYAGGRFRRRAAAGVRRNRLRAGRYGQGGGAHQGADLLRRGLRGARAGRHGRLRRVDGVERLEDPAHARLAVRTRRRRLLAHGPERGRGRAARGASAPRREGPARDGVGCKHPRGRVARRIRAGGVPDGRGGLPRALAGPAAAAGRRVPREGRREPAVLGAREASGCA